jgi:hypothetical protein
VRARLRAAGLPLLGAAAVASYLTAVGPDGGFPHAEHQGLFPVCTGCHLGIPTGDRSRYYPEPESCASCHDGDRADPVEWAGPAPRPSNLRFLHDDHMRRVAATGAAPLDCVDCHTPPGAPRMDIRPPLVERCLACHAHEAPDHFVDAACATCHLPLAASDLPGARIAGLARPATHEADAFLAETHALLAAAAPEVCATCHVREQCAGCHVGVNAGSPVAAIPASGGRVAAPSIPPRYPVPASHLDAAWELRHGVAAASPQACATCHTRDSCSTCHLAPRPAAIVALPSRADAAAPGAPVARSLPASHASLFFDTGHGPTATARPASCTTCHERGRFCGACHEPGAGPAPAAAAYTAPTAAPSAVADTSRAAAPQRPARSRAFHPPNFALRHSAQAWGRRLDCSSCHSTQLFCRDCHASAGLGSVGRLGPGYHDAEPVWLLRHGQAARQTLESCTTCHTQRDCMQCHSQLGAFRVSPHGPGFDARRAQRANPQICRACHLADPLAGR